MGQSKMNSDYIVVGCGSAGSVIARRLSDMGYSVLALEAGGSDRNPMVLIPGFANYAVASSHLNWKFDAEPDASRFNRVDTVPAGKCLGGGSSINGMMYIRGHREDYNGWAEMGCTGWDYQSLLPYFKRLEDNPRGADFYRGIGGPQSVSEARERSPLMDKWIEAVEEFGVPRNPDLNGEVPDGVDAVQCTQKAGWRHTAGSAFLRPVLGRANMRLELKAFVEKLEIKNGKVVSVDYRKNGRKITVHANKGVVLSAGAMVSPKLLLLSGIGPSSTLGEHGIDCVHELQGVGQNYQDHPAIMTSFNVNHETFGSNTGPIKNLLHGINFLLRGRGPLTTSIGHAQAFLRSSPDLALPDLQLITSPFAYDFDERGAKLVKDKAFGVAIGVQRPESRGVVSLHGKNPQFPPKIQFEMFGARKDLDTLVDGIKIARKLMQQAAMSAVYESERLPGSGADSDELLEQYIRNTAFSMYHQVGTCKMGTDDLAVVDPKLKVRGLSNLWVADASIMPTLPSGNTNATALMIGEKASDLISETE